jgi:BirA family biotin operon repressor/biotin-[acetyl-CoA-carboxylase] ligase
LVAEIYNELHIALGKFAAEGFETFLPSWNAYDYLAGQQVSVSAGEREISGLAKGVNAEGLLLVEDSTGFVHTVAAGDASLRQNQE